MNRQGSQHAAPAAAYPERITLSDTAEHYLDKLTTDLALGNVELWQLSPALRAFYVFAFEAGRGSLAPALRQANADADRFYTQLFDPRPEITTGPSYAQLQQIRAERFTGETLSERKTA